MRSTVFQNTDDCRVYLHLGVAVNTTTFKLETTAWNEASFRVPYVWPCLRGESVSASI